MLITQGKQFAKTLLKKEPRLRWEILGFVALMIIIQLLEFFTAMLFLQIRHETPIALFQNGAVLWRLVQLSIQIPGGLAKLWYGWHLWLHCSEAVEMLPRQTHYPKWHMLLLSVQNICIRTLLLQSVPLCLFAAYQMAKAGSLYAESAPWLFGAVQLVVVAVLLFLFWIYVCIGLWCTPFLWLAAPQTSLWRVPLLAMRIMRGKRTGLIATLAWYGAQMLPIVTIPWILPQAIVAIVTYFHIQIRQFAQEAISSNRFDKVCASAS